MGFGDFLKGAVKDAGKVIDDAAEGVGEVGSDIGHGVKGVTEATGEAGGRTLLGFGSAVTDLITGAQNAGKGPLHVQGVDAPATSPQLASRGANFSRELQQTVRDEGRTPQRAIQEWSNDPRVTGALGGAGRTAGEAVSTVVDPGSAGAPIPSWQQSIWGRNVIANTGEQVGLAGPQTIGAYGYSLDPRTTKMAVKGAQYAATHHPGETTAKVAKKVAEIAASQAHPENIASALLVGALTAGVSGGATAAAGGIRNRMLTKGLEEGAESALESGVRSELSNVAEGGIRRSIVEGEATTAAERAALTAEMQLPEQASRRATFRRTVDEKLATKNPASQWVSEKRGEAAQAILGSNPSNPARQVAAVTVQGGSNTALEGQLPGIAEANAARWRLQRGATIPGKINLASGALKAYTQPGAFARDEAIDFAKSHKDEAIQLAQEELRDPQVQARVLRTVQDNIDELPQPMQEQFEGLTHGTDLGDLQAQAEDFGQQKFDFGDDNGGDKGNEDQTSYDEEEPPQSPMMPMTYTSSPTPKPTDTMIGYYNRPGIGGRTVSFKKGSNFLKRMTGKAAGPRLWQGANRESLGGIGIGGPGGDWRKIELGHLAGGMVSSGGGSKRRAVPMNANAPRVTTGKKMQMPTGTLPRPPQAVGSTEPNFSPEVGKSELYAGMSGEDLVQPGRTATFQQASAPMYEQQSFDFDKPLDDTMEVAGVKRPVLRFQPPYQGPYAPGTKPIF